MAAAQNLLESAGMAGVLAGGPGRPYNQVMVGVGQVLVSGCTRSLCLGSKS